jgi:hypothetical protein
VIAHADPGHRDDAQCRDRSRTGCASVSTSSELDGSTARFALPAIAVFCDPSEPHAPPCLPGDALSQAHRVVAALAAVRAFGGPAERDASLQPAARAVARLLACLSNDADLWTG